jgi:type I restriction enzyme S subunit
VVKRLAGLIDLISGMHLSPENYSTSGEVPYFTGPSDFTNDLQTVTKWTKRTANVSQADDTLITVKGSGVGEIWYSTLPEVALGRQLMAIRSKNGSSRFIFQFLLTKRSRFEDLGSGNLIPGLSRTVILELEACFPSPNEQQRIADCLSSLDDLIAAQTQKHEALKTHKKGLMQQLFPSPEEPTNL